jgi:DNA-binding PadR family transcriptional regulator
MTSAFMTNQDASHTWSPNILGYAILQLLQRIPLSGYDLKKRFSTSLVYGWYANDSQIYPQLIRLEKHGFVVSRKEAGKAGPDRKVYTLTEKGDHMLREWLQSPLGESHQKNELLLRVWSLDLVSTDDFLRLLADAKSETTDLLGQLTKLYRRIREKYGSAESTPEPRHVGMLLCLEHDIQMAQTRLNWLSHAIEVVELRSARAAHAAALEEDVAPGESDKLELALWRGL